MLGRLLLSNLAVYLVAFGDITRELGKQNLVILAKHFPQVLSYETACS